MVLSCFVCAWRSMCRVNTSTHCHTLSIHLHIRGISQLRMSIPARQAKLESWCVHIKQMIHWLSRGKCQKMGFNRPGEGGYMLPLTSYLLWELDDLSYKHYFGSQTHLDGRMIWRCLAPLDQWMFLVVPGDSERFWIDGNGSQPALSFCIVYCLIWIYLDIKL